MATKLMNIVQDSFIPDVQYTTGTTATTFAAGQLTGGFTTVYVSTLGTPGSIATRTAAQMFADFKGAYPGLSWICRIVNGQGTGTLTVTAGTNVTTTGTLTVAINTWRDFVMTFTDNADVTMVSVATGTYS